MLATEQDGSLSPGSVGQISYPMFIEPTITSVNSGFSGYVCLNMAYTFLNLPENFW